MNRTPFFKRPARPNGYRWSDMALGRRRTAQQFKDTGYVVVSAYLYKGKMRYTDPVDPSSKPGPGVLYRVRIRKN